MDLYPPTTVVPTTPLPEQVDQLNLRCTNSTIGGGAILRCRWWKGDRHQPQHAGRDADGRGMVQNRDWRRRRRQRRQDDDGAEGDGGGGGNGERDDPEGRQCWVPPRAGEPHDMGGW